jgi:hypothetical protein
MIDKIKTFVIGLAHNKKLIETIKIFVIYGCLLAPVNFIVDSVFSTFKLSIHYPFFSVMGLITSFIDGVIASAIAGIIFYFLYEPVRNWIKRNNFLSKHINSIYTMFWKPFIIFTLITSLLKLLGLIGISFFVTTLTGPYGFLVSVGVILVWMVYIATKFAVYYFYSREISGKLGKISTW